MKEAHRLDQTRVFHREWRMRGVFFKEYHHQPTCEKGPTAKVEPNESEWEPVFIRHWHDIKRKVDPMHEPGPNAERHHVSKHVLDIDPKQGEERQEKVAEDDHHANPPPG